jgi:hypothetical protein
VTVVVDTFETFQIRARAAGDRFDVIVMNPPFSVPGRASIWAEHLLAAWELLAPGGRLLAIVPASVLNAGAPGTALTRGAQGSAQRLVWEHGTAEPLPRDAFAESGIMFGTAVVWLDRPVTDTADAPLWKVPPLPALSPMFRPYSGDETAVPVSRPLLTRGAAHAMPVQVWRDAWRNAERVLRYRAECVTCTRPLWGFDDGENDPRGVLGDHSAGFSLDPYEHNAPEAMPIGLCPLCGNDGAAYRRGLLLAGELWERVAAVELPADAFVSGWSQLTLAV